MGNEINNKGTRNGTIDLFRVAFALLIIMIHFNGEEKPLLLLANTIGRLGVPFFFLVSGFFFFKNDSRLKTFKFSDVWKYTKKTFWLWVVCSVFFSYHVWPMGVNPNNVFRLFQSLWGLNMAAGSLWYLIAAVEGLFIVSYVSAKFGRKGVLIAFLISFAICLLSTSYGSLLNFSPSIQSFLKRCAFENSFVAAVLWYSVSIFLVKFQKDFVFFARPSIFGGFVFLWGIEFIFVWFSNLRVASDLSIMLIPVAVSLFSWASVHRVALKKRTTVLLTQYSLYLYVMQSLAADIVASLLNQNTDKVNGMIFYTLVVVFDLIVSSAIIFCGYHFKSLVRHK